MIKINLIAETPAAGKEKRKRPAAEATGLLAKKGDLTLLALIVIALVVVGGMYLKLDGTRKSLKSTERERRATRDELQPFIEKVEELEAKRAALKHRIDIIQGLKDNQQGPVRVLDEVSKALPELVWLDNLTLAGNALRLRGKAMDENAVANYISSIEASLHFDEPTLTDMTRSGPEVFNFTLDCVFKPVPEGLQAPAGTDA